MHGLAVREIFDPKKYSVKKNGTHQPDDLARREALLCVLAKRKLSNNQQSTLAISGVLNAV
jgi:hypothetical protein